MKVMIRGLIRERNRHKKSMITRTNERKRKTSAKRFNVSTESLLYLMENNVAAKDFILKKYRGVL